MTYAEEVLKAARVKLLNVTPGAEAFRPLLLNGAVQVITDVGWHPHTLIEGRLLVPPETVACAYAMWIRLDIRHAKRDGLGTLFYYKDVCYEIRIVRYFAPLGNGSSSEVTQERWYGILGQRTPHV